MSWLLFRLGGIEGSGIGVAADLLSMSKVSSQYTKPNLSTVSLFYLPRGKTPVHNIYIC